MTASGATASGVAETHLLCDGSARHTLSLGSPNSCLAWDRALPAAQGPVPANMGLWQAHRAGLFKDHLEGDRGRRGRALARGAGFDEQRAKQKRAAAADSGVPAGPVADRVGALHGSLALAGHGVEVLDG